ncbi:uncharacterized protein LOC116337761 [Contarinia nasturtii]|uniref:uncharacterized protein LOC116337761 n=1 Tax=Contarinia nasturtii TaxID=265458 RepID=UPI0012D4BD05|nr:uncharacterized protein LOC116337761 [Contarinia nasturtii]
MSSASLVEKRSLRKSQSRNIETSSTSITSAPTTSESKLHDSNRRLKDKSMRSKQRDSLPDIGVRKGNRSVRASNFELSSSANDFENKNNNDRVSKTGTKLKTITATVNKSANVETGDKVLEMIKMDSTEQENYKNQAEIEYNELKKRVEELQMIIEQERKHPTSEYDESIEKQQQFNETLRAQVAEAKDKLKNLSQSLKTLRSCRKDCNIHMRDLIIDYNCITKSELSKELKRFQRMEIDLKNNLDRLHWRMDCESKMYHNLIDQYHKLQMDLYYLKNLTESS